MEEGSIIKNDINKAPKTGDWGFIHPHVEASKCIGCETCVPYCPDACIEMKDRNKAELLETPENFKKKQITEFDREFCKGCGVCAAVCPVKAITMKK